MIKNSLSESEVNRQCHGDLMVYATFR